MNDQFAELRRFDQGLHLSHCCASEHTEPTLHGDNLHHGCTTACRICLRCVWDSIERLLADEREKWLAAFRVYKFDPKDLDPLHTVVDFLAAIRRDEREKVREMCAAEAKEQIELALSAFEDKSVLGTVVAEHIRQLDLTAPSSTEEETND